MLTFIGFSTKKAAIAFKKSHNGLLAYENDRFGRSKNKDHYSVAVTVGRLNKTVYPYCVYYEI